MNGRRNLVVVGGGGHARVVIEAARTRPDLWNVIGFTDPRACHETSEALQIERLGDDTVCTALAEECWFIVGVGSVGVSGRRAAVVAQQLTSLRWATVVHATAWLASTARLGPGTFVGAGAVVNSGALVGEHVVVNTGAIVEHDVRVGEFVQVGPSAAVGGGAVVHPYAYLGLGCRVRDHISIGARALVGMGAVVINDVPAGTCVAGVPARPLTGRKP